MVNEAKAETAQSEKLLKEAKGKNEVLEAEVKALKELVLTSTPSAPNKHLHPQLSVVNGSSVNSTHNSQQNSQHHRGASSGGHSRNSSLNQQSFNNLAQNLNNNNNSGNNGSNSNLSASAGGNNPVSLQVPPKIFSVASVGGSLNTSSGIINSSGMGNGNAGARLTNSSTSLQPLSGLSNKQQQQHRRVPSQNDLAGSTKTSFIDKLFQSSSSTSVKPQPPRQEEVNTIAVANYAPELLVVDIADVIVNFRHYKDV
jgi:hypothetical protein